MHEFLTICGALLQLAGFIACVVYGAALTRKISRRLALSLAIVVIGGLVAGVFYFSGQPLTYVPQTAFIWLTGFGGGIAARVKLDIENESKTNNKQ